VAEAWNDQKQSAAVIELLGTHWSSFYKDDGFVAALAAAATESEKQAQALVEETAAIGDRQTMPLLHTKNWYALVLRQSEMRRNGYRYGLGLTYGTGVKYGETGAGDTFDFPLPPALVSIGAAVERLNRPTCCWLSGIDCTIEDGFLRLRSNPFEDSAFTKNEIFNNGVIVDFETVLWLFKTGWDKNYPEKHYGYLFDLQLPSSTCAMRLLNAVMDAAIDGTSRRHIDEVVAAATGLDFCRTDGEIVELVTTDRNGLVLATDRNVYRFPSSVVPQVSKGDVLAAGDQLVDALQPIELNRGTESVVPLIELDRGFLPADFAYSLVFNNLESPVTVSEGGTTALEFDVGGAPNDVALFWQLVRAAEQERGYTLAQLLDRRTPPLASEPTTATLPATINPAEFLADNLLIGNALLYVVKSQFATEGLGLSWLRVFRDIVPPWNAVIVIVSLSVADAAVPLVDEDAVVNYATGENTDTVDLSQGETAPKLRGISCYCL